MAVEEEHLLRVLIEFRDELAAHRQVLADRADAMEGAFDVLSRSVAGQAADEFLERSLRSRHAFVAYEEAVRDITAILGERIDALQGR